MSRSFEVTVNADQGSDGRSSKNFYRTKNPKTQDLIQAAIHWPSDLEGILPILRCQISYLQKGKGLAMYFLGPFCYNRYLGMIGQASQGSLQLSSPQPGRSSVRKKRTGQSGCGWSWVVLGSIPPPSIAHSVQSPQARKVDKGAGTRWCPLAMVHCSSRAVSQAGCGLRAAEEPLLVSHLGTEEDTELVQFFLLQAI